MEERDLEATGVKAALQTRLRAALEEGGEDPENFRLISGSIEERIEERSRNMEENLEGNSTSLKHTFEQKFAATSRNCQLSERRITESHQQLAEKINENSRAFEAQLREVGEDVEKKISAITDQFNSLKRTAAAGASTRTVHIKPPTYEGKTPWCTYWKQFEAATAANGWTQEDKAAALVTALRGDALNILQTITDNEQGDYDCLVARLEMRYGDKHLQQVYHSQLVNRRQKRGETLREFEADIACLVRTCCYLATA